MIVESVTLSLRDGSAEIVGRAETSLLHSARDSIRQIERAAGVWKLRVLGLKLDQLPASENIEVGFEVHFTAVEENVIESVELVYDWLMIAARCAGKWIEPDLKVLVLAFNMQRKKQATIHVGSFDEAEAVARDIAEMTFTQWT